MSRSRERSGSEAIGSAMVSGSSSCNNESGPSGLDAGIMYAFQGHLIEQLSEWVR